MLLKVYGPARLCKPLALLKVCSFSCVEHGTITLLLSGCLIQMKSHRPVSCGGTQELVPFKLPRYHPHSTRYENHQLNPCFPSTIWTVVFPNGTLDSGEYFGLP